jgi:hypothetical protein
VRLVLLHQSLIDFFPLAKGRKRLGISTYIVERRIVHSLSLVPVRSTSAHKAKEASCERLLLDL